MTVKELIDELSKYHPESKVAGYWDSFAWEVEEVRQDVADSKVVLIDVSERMIHD